jgi:hypothetical protein
MSLEQVRILTVRQIQHAGEPSLRRSIDWFRGGKWMLSYARPLPVATARVAGFVIPQRGEYRLSDSC